MKNVLLILCLAGGLSACKKDKFESVPQIEFIDVVRNVVPRQLTSLEKDLAPILRIKVRDAEGDFGRPGTTDSSSIIIKHLLTNDVDSVPFPDLSRAPKSNFEADVEVNLFGSIGCLSGGPARPRVDTIFYQVYIRDGKNNKSNVITTSVPVLRTCE